MNFFLILINLIIFIDCIQNSKINSSTHYHHHHHQYHHEKDLGDVLLVTALGKIRGTYLTSQAGYNYYAFRGIRYAKPPINQLRFKAPEPIEQTSGIFDATIDGPSCPQPEYYSTMNSISDISEDCLRLNIYTNELPPSNNDDNENDNKFIKKPVLIYIHPGGYYSLSGQSKNYAGVEYLMDRNIVVVTLNYRLGALGFLSTGTTDAIGNMGLKDQVVALKWIKLHISRFGGDPNAITLLGYGVGAISVSLHMISPMSKNLFHRAILMSGAITAQWKLTNHQLALSRKQGNLLNCSQHNINEMVHCMKNKTIIDYSRTLPELFEFGTNNPFLLWKPVIEPDLGQERFLIEDPLKSYQNGRFMRIPIIAGITEKEFVGPAIAILKNQTLRTEFDNNFENLAPICLMYEQKTKKSKSISQELRKTFLGSGSLHPERSLDGLSQLFADGLIGFGVHRFVHLAARFVKVYYYQFTYPGRYSHLYYPEHKPYGVVHHDDLLYLFVQSSIAPMFTEDAPEYRTVQKMTRLWAAFAHKGDPNKYNDEYLKDLRWRPFNFRREPFLQIGHEFEMLEFLNNDRYQVWKKLFPLNWIQRIRIGRNITTTNQLDFEF